jgi:hypothetical protein
MDVFPTKSKNTTSTYNTSPKHIKSTSSSATPIASKKSIDLSMINDNRKGHFSRRFQRNKSLTGGIKNTIQNDKNDLTNLSTNEYDGTASSTIPTKNMNTNFKTNENKYENGSLLIRSGSCENDAIDIENEAENQLNTDLQLFDQYHKKLCKISRNKLPNLPGNKLCFNAYKNVL